LAKPVYHQQEGFAVVKVQFSDFGDDLPSGCTKLTLVLVASLGQEVDSRASAFGVRHRIVRILQTPSQKSSVGNLIAGKIDHFSLTLGDKGQSG
jgi:hypothetical protein